MPTSYSAAAVRNAELYKQWDEVPDAYFAKLGIPRDKIKQLQSRLRGKIVLPDSADYDEARKLSNPVFDDYPEMIVYCETEHDAQITLKFSIGQKAEFCVRSGGHCTAGFSSGPGVLIDVSKLDGIHVAHDLNSVTVGCGTKFGDLDATLQLYKRTVPGGECPDVCVGGYVQGGGYGFTSVTHGMSCDNVLAMRVLLASGAIVWASKDTNSDLWYAMRGGTGGNFGILLSITYRLFEIDEVYGFAFIWPLTDDTAIGQAADAMLLLQKDYMYDSPYAPEMNMQVSLAYQSKIHVGDPAGDFIPCFMVRGLWTGTPQAGADAVRAIAALPGCIEQWEGTAPFAVMNRKLLEFPQEMPTLTGPVYEDKLSRYVSEMLTREQWVNLFTFFTTGENNLAYGYMEFYGGQITNPVDGPNAFIHRDVAYNLVMDVFWHNDEERALSEKFLEGWKAMVSEFWNGHVYQNYPSVNDPDYARHYWGSVTGHLTRVKAKYDPDNLFTFAQQVPYAPGTAYRDDRDMPDELASALMQDIDFTGGVHPPGDG